jgi:transposase
MSKEITWAGVDVGKDDIWVSVAGAKARRFVASAAGVRDACRWVVSHLGEQTVGMCMESTGVYSYRIAVLCQSQGMAVSVVNPAQIVAFAKAQLRRTKTDAVDAEVIRCFALSQQPPQWQPPRPGLRCLYGLVAEWDRLRETKLQLSNRDHSHDFTPDLPKEVRVAQRAIHRALDRQIQKLEQAIAITLQHDVQAQQQIDLLCTIPGIANITALRLIAYGKELWTNRTPKELAAHAGLAPRHRQSGSSVRGKSRLAKQGDQRLRTILYMPTLCAIVHNPYLKQYYQRLLAGGKTKLLAVTACMRKLLLLVRAILNKQKPFALTQIALT